jgi:hypothetical protein
VAPAPIPGSPAPVRILRGCRPASEKSTFQIFCVTTEFSFWVVSFSVSRNLLVLRYLKVLRRKGDMPSS